MTILQHTGEQLVVRAGPRMFQTTLTLDRGHGIARVERAAMMIPLKSKEYALGEIRDVVVSAQQDPASGAERYTPALKLADGRVIVLPPFDDKAEAEHTADEMREFVGLRH
jgi:hypothetical protein